jgi:hypothetical protein
MPEDVDAHSTSHDLNGSGGTMTMMPKRTTSHALDHEPAPHAVHLVQLDEQHAAQRLYDQPEPASPTERRIR